MTRLFGAHPVVGWLALAIALFAVLGHVCVLPHEAHAAGAEASADHGSHGGHSEHHALHAASCEAVTPSMTSPAPGLETGAAAVLATSAEPAAVVRRDPRSPAMATSPPLFLLHSALRI